jgi:hypothetical protein
MGRIPRISSRRTPRRLQSEFACPRLGPAECPDGFRVGGARNADGRANQGNPPALRASALRLTGASMAGRFGFLVRPAAGRRK